MLTLNLSPKTSSAEEAVRKSGSSPRTIMRLMSSELVAKLYEYLVSKWKISPDTGGELVLFCKGSKMLLTDLLGDYQENCVTVRIALEYDIVGSSVDDATTAASTPVSLKVPHIEELSEPMPMMEPSQAVTISDKKTKKKSSDDEPKKRRKQQSANLLVESKLASFETSCVEERRVKACVSKATQTDIEPLPREQIQPHALPEIERMEAFCKEIIAGEREFCMKLMEAQMKCILETSRRDG